MSQNIYGPGSSLVGGHYVQSTGTPSISSDIPVYSDTSGLFLVDSGTKLSDKLSVNGSLPMTGVLDMGNHDIKNTDDVVPNTTAVSDIGATSKRYRAAYVDNVVGPVVTSGLLSPAVTNTDDLGSSSKRYKTVYYTNLDPAISDTTTVVAANGFGAAAGPALTLTATPNGILKSNGTTMTAATDADITGKLLTGYVSGAGTVAASDSLLQSVQKLNGNDALNLPKSGGTMSGPLAMGTNNITNVGTLSGAAISRNADDILSIGGAIPSGDVPMRGALSTQLVTSGFAASDVVIANPGTVTSGHLPQYQTGTGRLIASSGIASNTIVIGPASVTTGNLASYNGTTGKLLADAAILTTNVLTNTGGTVTANQIPVFSGTGGRLLTNSSASIASGVVSATRFFPSSPSWYEGSTTSGGTTSFSAGTPKKLTISSFTSPAASNFSSSGQVITYNGTENATFHVIYNITSTQQASAYTLNYGITTNASTALSSFRSQTTSVVAGPLIDVAATVAQIIGLAQNDTVDLVGQCSTTLTIAHPVITCTIKQVN